MIRTSSARPISRLLPTGGVVGLRGNLAPEGAIVKVAGMERLQFPARRAASTARKLASRRSRKRSTRKAKCWSSATKDRKAVRACGKCCRPRRRSTDRAWATKVALITDGRFSGATRGFCVGHVGPEAAVGGPIGLLRDGDIITIDAVKGTLDVELSDAELATRKKEWKPRPEALRLRLSVEIRAAGRVGALWRAHASGRDRRERVLCGYLTP